nr:LuxR C-terminal-related transcriptional regulator [Amycolatopsis bullii]
MLTRDAHRLPHVLLARGEHPVGANREIARRLVVAETTIKSCMSSILAKLDVRNRVEVALVACRVGLVPLHHPLGPA